MNRQAVPLLIIPVEGDEYTLAVPQGECAYWSEVVNRHLGDSVMGTDWLAEGANVPYLGRVALASDKLAQEWLVDHHATEETV
jgi:hypothetical protein